MGLISGLLTLPLAPVRGTVWIGEQVLEQAERERNDERRDPRAADGDRGWRASRADRESRGRRAPRTLCSIA